MSNYTIVRNIVTEEEISQVVDYINSAQFNTKDNHIPLHDPLFAHEFANFGIVTYGDMPKHVVDIFNKCCTSIQEKVSELSGIEYDPPILGKSYIMQYEAGSSIGLFYDTSRPVNTYRSMMFWSDVQDGAKLKFKNYKLGFDPGIGDCVIFPESEEYSREITEVKSNNLYFSDFWNAPKGQSPYTGLEYKDIYWGNPLWE